MHYNQHSSDVYTIVTNQIIAQLEKGTIPWRKPWAEAGPPQNLLSKRLYRGINIWLLLGLGYERNLFLTPKQINEIGGSIKKGEKGNLVIFWKLIDKSKEDSHEETEAVRKTALLRYYWVFNVAQCDNIEQHLPSVETSPNNPISVCEDMVAQMQNPPIIQFKEPQAYYHPGKDFVNMPKLKTFINSEAYYATLFHELVHSTGHTSRLFRKGVQEMTPFGSDIYSMEEIIAELGTCYLTSVTGIAPVTFENNTAYLQGWIERLKNDKHVIVYASMQAQKAADYILNVRPDETGNDIIDVEETNANSIMG